MDYGKIFYEVARTFMIWGLVGFTYECGKIWGKIKADEAGTSRSFIITVRPYIGCITVIALLSGSIMASYGTHEEGNDPVHGDGEVVVDFIPTQRQTNEYGLTVFLKFIIPALVGVHAGRKTKTVEEL